MRLKYYLRGLSVGILCTMVMMMIAFAVRSKAPAMTDEQIIKRAKELGLIEQSEQGKTQDTTGNDPTGNDPTADTPSDGDTAPSDTGEGGDTPTADGDAAAGTEPPADDSGGLAQGSATEWVTITVEKGEFSNRISQKLYDAQLIDDPVAFNKYLVNAGMDTRLVGGAHSIPKGSSTAEIAKLLTEKQNP